MMEEHDMTEETGEIIGTPCRTRTCDHRLRRPVRGAECAAISQDCERPAGGVADALHDGAAGSRVGSLRTWTGSLGGPGESRPCAHRSSGVRWRMLSRVLLIGAVLWTGCAPAPEPDPEGPFDVWLYDQPGAKEWERPHEIDHRYAVESLNELAGSECFRLIGGQRWDGSEPPAGVIVSTVDGERLQEREDAGRRTGEIREGENVRGMADETAPGGGWVITKPTSRTEDATIVHEVLHIALGDEWPHDATGFFAALDGDESGLSAETRARLRAVCR